MDWRDFAMVLLSMVSIGIGWILRVVWDAIATLRNDLQALQNSLPGTYARRDDVREMFDALMVEVRALRDDLRHKVDK